MAKGGNPKHPMYPLVSCTIPHLTLQKLVGGFTLGIWCKGEEGIK